MNKKNIELRGNVLWTGKPRKRTDNFGNNEIRYRLNLMTKIGVVNCWINIKDKPDYYRLKVGKGDVIEIETKQITENDDGDLWCYVTLSRKFDIITDHGYTSKLIEQEYSGKRDKLDTDDFFILTKNKINKEYWEKVGNKLSIWFMKNYGKFFKLKTLEILLSFLEDLYLHSGMKLGLRARKLKYLETPDGLEIIESRPASGLYSSAFYGVPETHVKAVLSIARENGFNIKTEDFLFISEMGETFIDLYKHVMRPAYCEEYRFEKEEKLKQSLNPFNFFF